MEIALAPGSVSRPLRTKSFFAKVRPECIAMVDTDSGEFIEKTLPHEGNAVREFYAALEGPVVVGIEATGAMQWFLELLEALGIECRVGHPAKI